MTLKAHHVLVTETILLGHIDVQLCDQQQIACDGGSVPVKLLIQGRAGELLTSQVEVEGLDRSPLTSQTWSM